MRVKTISYELIKPIVEAFRAGKLAADEAVKEIFRIASEA